VSPKRAARPGTPEGLREDLAFAASRRLPYLFKDRGADEETYPSLARVVAAIEPRLWDTDPTRALLVVMRRAIDQLPAEKARREFSERSTWRDVARLLYFGSEADPSLRTYSEYRRRVKELTGYHWNASEKDLVRFTAEVRGRLADVLLAMTSAPAERETASNGSDDPAPTDPWLIDRPEHLDHLQALVDAGHRVICLWGEPGTGKSTLAARFSRKIARGAPAPVIRCAPMLEAVTPEAEIFRQDLAIALTVEGVDPTKLSKAMWFSRLCEQLAGQPRSAAIVLDNVEADELIAQAVAARPKIPVIMTTRKRPQRPEVVCEELDDFTEPQARDFIKHHLPEEADEDVKALAHVLGFRPLALEHAVVFVRESPDISVKELVQSLATKAADTLSAVTPLDQIERNLAGLYELVLTSLERHEDARAVLDSILAVAGGSGIGYREIVYLFMRSEAGGAHDRLHFRSGLRELGRRGLVRERQGVISRELEESGYAGRSPYQLAMHALTYSILRELRGPKPLAIEAKYWDWVLAGGHQTLPEDDTNAHEHAYLALLRWSMRASSGGLPRGWASLFCTDSRTWIALMEADEGDPAGTYIVRYAVRPNDMYKLDYRSGKWSSLDHDEGVLLYLLITIHYERIHNVLQNERSLLGEEEEPGPDEAPQPEQPRLDDEVTPADGYRHVILEPLTQQSYLGLGWYLWALCGKRFVPTSADLPEACPDCESLRSSTERLADIETALRNRYFTGLDYKNPVAASRLFLSRAKLRRELGRPGEAADDLDRTYRFLLVAADASDREILTLGQGLAREAALLPEPHRQLAFRVYDHLLWRFRESRGAKRRMRTTLVLERARLLEQSGQTVKSRADHKTGGDGAEAGRLDAGGVKQFNALWQQEQAERKLGHTHQANATLRQAIAAAEREYGEGKLLVACLMLSGAYLAGENPRQAREDLQRALRIAGAQQPPDYENMWDCLIKLSNIELALGSAARALDSLEEALKIARDHVPKWVQDTEQAIARMRGMGNSTG
jgi:tetratricopeptide (TPR) repeat protein